MKLSLRYLLVLAIGLAAGSFLFAFLENHQFLTFDSRITLGEFANAISTVVAALGVTVFVTYFIERHNQADRTEKELLLRQLDVILKHTEDFEKTNESEILTDVVAAHKKLSTTNASFFKILQDFKYSEHVLNNVNLAGVIKDLRRLATDTPIKGIENHAKKSRCSATVKEGIIKLAAERKALLDQKINELKSKILTSQLIINRR